MEWFILLVVFIFIVSKIGKSISSSADIRSAEHSTNHRSFKLTISGPEYSGWAEKKPDDFKWIPPGVSVNILGYEITDGMIYIGTHMKSVTSDYSSEPGFINTGLPIKRSSPDHEGQGLSYWPSYSEISPASRAAYLEWLAGGRFDPAVNIGYVFLFFYGLERRLLHDTTQSTVPKDEIERIVYEVKRLNYLYGRTNGSFNHYAGALLEFMQLKHKQTKLYDLEPPRSKYTYEVSPIVKLALGQLAKEGKPLSAKWVYEYVMHHPEINLRTPARRCQDEFKKLFILRYKKKFADGIIIKPNKTKVKYGYHCASASLREYSSSITWDVPDVSILKSLLNKITPITEECQNDLDKYSRWLGQNSGSKESLIAFSLLPDELADSAENKEAESLKTWISNRMNGEDSSIVDNKELIEKWPVKTPGRMKKSEALSFISLLEKMGYCIAPDIRFDNIGIKEPGISVLFKPGAAPESAPSADYSGQTLLLHLAAVVAKADGVIADSERALLLDFVEASSPLKISEKQRMKALLTWHLNSDTATQGLKKRLESIEPNRKRNLAGYLITVAGADGYISPEEIKMLTKLYKLLGLDAKEVYSDIHLFQVDKKSTANEPISVRPADKGKTGYAIPKPPADEGFKLDTKKLKDRLKETAEVSEILKDVFEDDIQDEPDEVEVPVEAGNDSIHGLDYGHSEILMAFQQQKVWSKTEFKKLTAKYDLMPDGALDTLNEKSLEICEEVLCDGEDPIEINQEILEELIK